MRRILSPPGETPLAASGGLWEDFAMTGALLTARLHVDLQRVSSAVCRMSSHLADC
jgi:hypothetical protein